MIHVVYIAWVALQLLVTILVCLTISFVVITVIEDVKTYYEKWRLKKRIQRLKREHEEFSQRQRERILQRELRKKEREKYPLFYWRELCSESVNEHTEQRKERII